MKAKLYSFLVCGWPCLLAVHLPFAGLGQSVYTPYTFVTLAGSPGNSGANNGVGSAARFHAPHSVAVDGLGWIYVADVTNHTIRKISPDGTVSTLAGLAGNAGSADGIASQARFNGPWGVAVDRAGNVYVADTGNSTIRKISPRGAVSTLAGLAGNAGSADGTGSAARFALPHGLTVDGAANLFVTDQHNCTIRKISPGGVVTTVAGLAETPGNADGTGSAARFRYPAGIAVDNAGTIFISDEFNHTIRKITTNAVVSTLAGLAGSAGSVDGTGSAARFYNPHGCALDSAGNLYVSEFKNDTVRRITPAAVVTTLAGVPGTVGSADGTGNAARFSGPRHACVDSLGNIYVADWGNHTIRKGWPAGALPTIRLAPPVIAGGQALLDFTILTGSASSLTLLQSSEPSGSWRTNASAVLSTLVPGVSCRFTAPFDGAAQFYRIQAP